MKQSSKRLSTLVTLTLATTFWSTVGLADLKGKCERIEEKEKALLNLSNRSATVLAFDDANALTDIGLGVFPDFQGFESLNLWNFLGTPAPGFGGGLINGTVTEDGGIVTYREGIPPFIFPFNPVPDEGGLDILDGLLGGDWERLLVQRTGFSAGGGLIDLTANSELVVEFDFNGKVHFTPDPETGELHPFGDAISDPNKDFRLGMPTVGLLVAGLDPTAPFGFGVPAAIHFGMTNNDIYAFQHYHPFGRNFYYPIREKKHVDEMIRGAVSYSLPDGVLRMYINDELVLSISDFNQIPPENYTVLHNINFDNGVITPPPPWNANTPTLANIDILLQRQLDGALPKVLLDDDEVQRGLLQQNLDIFYTHPSIRDANGNTIPLSNDNADPQLRAENYFVFPAGPVANPEDFDNCVLNNCFEQRNFGSAAELNLRSVKISRIELDDKTIKRMIKYRKFLEENCQNIENESNSDYASDDSS